MRIRKIKYFGFPKRICSASLPLLFLGITLTGCGSSKYQAKEANEEKTANYEQESSLNDSSVPDSPSVGSAMDDHISISAPPMTGTAFITDQTDSVFNPIQGERKIELSPEGNDTDKPYALPDRESASAVARQIVENYLNSQNKEPGGHCLSVSKSRFEKAYEDVYGHSFYQDLPDSMARSVYSPREVFDFLYFSTSGAHNGWRSLPVQFRGKGNAGAIAFAGMGTLVDWFGIWSGKLKPGAPMQVWKRRDDYELVVNGMRKKDFDPFGHSFIFLEYVRDEENKITGIRIADQGYQSYRPLLPNDYEVWWAVNLSI